MNRVPRPSRPALSAAYVVDQALQLLDDVGVDAFTMRLLGQRVGANPMAFYHYFPTKAELFDAVVERLYQDAANATIDASDARSHVLQLFEGLRSSLLEHPRALPLVATRPVRTAGLFALVDTLVNLLEQVGVPAARLLDTVTLLTTFAIGQVLAQGAPEAGGEAPPTNFLPPGVERALSSGGYDPDWQFHTGLRALLDAARR